MFWLGLLTGVGVYHIIREVRDAWKYDDTSARLYRCSIQIAKLDTERRLSTLSNEELIRAVAQGLEPLARGDDDSRGVHSKVRSR